MQMKGRLSLESVSYLMVAGLPFLGMLRNSKWDSLALSQISSSVIIVGSTGNKRLTSGATKYIVPISFSSVAFIAALYKASSAFSWPAISNAKIRLIVFYLLSLSTEYEIKYI